MATSGSAGSPRTAGSQLLVRSTKDRVAARMISEKPPKLVAVALAGKMARMIWALSVKEESYRTPAAIAAAA